MEALHPILGVVCALNRGSDGAWPEAGDFFTPFSQRGFSCRGSLPARGDAYDPRSDPGLARAFESPSLQLEAPRMTHSVAEQAPALASLPGDIMALPAPEPPGSAMICAVSSDGTATLVEGNSRTGWVGRTVLRVGDVIDHYRALSPFFGNDTSG